MPQNKGIYLSQRTEKLTNDRGAEHPDTAGRLNNLATLYNNQGKYEQAEPLYQHALTIREKRLGGAKHPDTRTVQENYAGLLQNIKDEREEQR